jgi:hypothetical protein
MLGYSAKPKEASCLKPLKLAIAFGGLTVATAILGMMWMESVDTAPSRRPADTAERSVLLAGYSIPLHEQESVPEDEDRLINATNEVVGEFFKKIYAEGSQSQDIGSGLHFSGTRRSAHPKPNGCLSGDLTVAAVLNTKDQVGIFKKPGRKFKVIARFSSGNPRPNEEDKVPDNRGIGLKVFGVEDAHLIPDLPGNEVTQTQDFAMNGTDAFISSDVAGYHRFEQIALLETTDLKAAAKKYMFELGTQGRLPLLKRVFHAFSQIGKLKATNPLGIQYWSISAFQHGLGNSAPLVKYSLAPCGGPWTEHVDSHDPNFLRTNMKRAIKEKPACFRFLIQNQKSATDAIEDLTRPWNPDELPFHEVARIVFPRQELLDELACEQTVITPWNTLPEHKPVGGINRLRLGAYLMSVKMRKQTNKFE